MGSPCRKDGQPRFTATRSRKLWDRWRLWIVVKPLYPNSIPSLLVNQPRFWGRLRHPMSNFWTWPISTAPRILRVRRRAQREAKPSG